MCLLRPESVRAGCSDLCPVGYLQGQRLNSLFEQPVPVLDHLHRKKLSYVYMKFLVFSMCSLPLVLSLGRGWVCCLYSSHRVFMCMDKSPWAFSRLRSPSSLLLCQVLQSLNHLCSSVLDSLQYVHVSLWGAHHWTQCSRCVLPGVSGGEGSAFCWQCSV